LVRAAAAAAVNSKTAEYALPYAAAASDKLHGFPENKSSSVAS
jgi:hypothetical protein